jgi:hypothetical protein
VPGHVGDGVLHGHPGLNDVVPEHGPEDAHHGRLIIPAAVPQPGGEGEPPSPSSGFTRIGSRSVSGGSNTVMPIAFLTAVAPGDGPLTPACGHWEVVQVSGSTPALLPGPFTSGTQRPLISPITELCDVFAGFNSKVVQPL